MRLTPEHTRQLSGGQVVQTWRIMEPVLRAGRDGAVPLEDYVAGSAAALTR
jgi:hypothetical protein